MSGKTKILMILGMHRSGTSLTAQWLSSCGLKLGDSLAGAGVGNLKGHYEDNDFLNFHNEILDYNNLTYLTEGKSISINDAQLLKAKYILNYKSELYDEWGWKEPRTCLFVNSIYAKIIENPFYFVLVRDYKEVITSLYSRDLKIVKNKIYFPRGYIELYKFKKLQLEKMTSYLKTWIHYNKELLKLLKSKPNNIIVASLDDLLNSDKEIIDHLVDSWGFSLEKKSINSILDSGMLNKNVGSLPKIASNYISEAETIQKELNSFRTFNK